MGGVLPEVGGCPKTCLQQQSRASRNAHFQQLTTLDERYEIGSYAFCLSQ
jgi:hypothetical protein